MHYLEHLDSPCGPIEITANDSGILSIYFVDSIDSPENANPLTSLAKAQLREYLNDERQSFDLPLRPNGTVFQKKVWQALLEIPYGEVNSYLDIATKIGNPKACRAVGAANGKNPIGIVVPCHRVIGANGTLTGYAGGLSRKQWLLEHEKAKSQKRLFT
jgi:methylated-DNA-[protein]-cysteine S-methyltransferase